jgi:hypothetical protein
MILGLANSADRGTLQIPPMSKEAPSHPPVGRDVIELQLQRLQASSHFKHSLRCSSFLDYVVRKTIEGSQDQLKERTIGVEAFNRPPAYDLSSDPIVRTVAGEVRKRLTQYYYEPEHQDELRIELHPGSYIPEFKPVAARALDSGEATAPEPAPAPAIDHSASQIGTAPAVASPPALRRRRIVALLASLSAATVACASLVVFLYPPPLQRFWQPVLHGSGQALICVGSVLAMVPSQSSSVSAASVGGHPLSSNPLSIADAIAISNLQQLLSRHSRASTIQSAAETEFPDLQRGPVILVSGFNNPWSMRLTDPLRFHFLRPATDIFEIQDRTDPIHGTWAINTLTPLSRISHDYGIVARFHDPTTDQTMIVAAGIGENGTVAASELLSNEKYFLELTREGRLPRRYQNVEAVIETQVIDGKHGPPRVIAVCTW